MMTTVVNPWHWLTEDGSFPPEPRLRAKTIRVAQCIEYGGPLPRGHGRETLVPCSRRPQRTPCSGLLWVVKQRDDAILAFCGTCHADEFLIYEWEDTEWAEGMMPPVDVRPPDDAQRVPPARDPNPLGPPAHGATERRILLKRALALVGSTMHVDEVERVVATSPTPSAVLQAILATTRAAPPMASIDRLLPVLIEMWNLTPRPELGDATPAAVFAGGAARRERVGRNDPCPCGSGTKYKKCCAGRTVH